MTVTFTLKECSAPFALVASIIILERGDATPSQRDSIPPEIWLGKRSHLIPYPGDQGIMYEARDDLSPAKAEEIMELQLRLQEEGNSDG